MDRWAGRLPKMEYPDYAAEIEQIRLTGITTDLLDRIIERHQGCQRHMMDLYGRYRTEADKVPIFTREPRFSGDDDHEAESAINNRVNNDFLGEIVDGKVYINGSDTPLEEPYLPEPMEGSYGPYTVPEGSYFMLGDNRNNSRDARYWENKFVKKEKIIAKVLFCYYPLSQFGPVE